MNANIFSSTVTSEKTTATETASTVPEHENPPTSFSGWFWKSIFLIAGFNESVIEQLMRGKKAISEIPDRHGKKELKWAEPLEVEHLVDCINEYFANVKDLEDWEERRSKDLAVKLDYVSRVQYHIVKERVKATTPTKAFFYTFFQKLNCFKCAITRLDPVLLSFTSLQELSITGNDLEVLENLPESVMIVSACGNKIRQVSSLAHNQQLRYIGLSYNQLDSLTNLVRRKANVAPPPSITDRASLLPPIPPPKLVGTDTAPDYLCNLASLDLSFNSFTDLPIVVEKLKSLPSLVLLCLMGNPMSLLSGYRPYVGKKLPKLQSLDDKNFTPEERDQLATKNEKKLLSANPLVKVEISIADIAGLIADLDYQPPPPEEPEDKKSNKKKPAAAVAAKKPPLPAGDKKAAADAAAAELVPKLTRQTFVVIECEISGTAVSTPEIPKHPLVPEPPKDENSAPETSRANTAKTPTAASAKSLAESAAPPPAIDVMQLPFDKLLAPPVSVNFTQKLEFPPSLEIRDALITPVVFRIKEVTKVIKTTPVPPDLAAGTTDPPPVPQVVLMERTEVELGRCVANFSEVIAATPEKVTKIIPMTPNEKVHLRHLDEEKRKRIAAQKQAAAAAAASQLASLVPPGTPIADSLSATQTTMAPSITPRESNQSSKSRGNTPPPKAGGKGGKGGLSVPSTASGGKRRTSAMKKLEQDPINMEPAPLPPMRYINPQALEVKLTVAVALNPLPPPPPPPVVQAVDPVPTKKGKPQKK